jgi:hypothetical protein
MHEGTHLDEVRVSGNDLDLHGDSDEAGRLYRFEAGQRSEAKPDIVPT